MNERSELGERGKKKEKLKKQKQRRKGKKKKKGFVGPDIRGVQSKRRNKKTYCREGNRGIEKNKRRGEEKLECRKKPLKTRRKKKIHETTGGHPGEIQSWGFSTVCEKYEKFKPTAVGYEKEGQLYFFLNGQGR